MQHPALLLLMCKSSQSATGVVHLSFHDVGMVSVDQPGNQAHSACWRTLSAQPSPARPPAPR